MGGVCLVDLLLISGLLLGIALRRSARLGLCGVERMRLGLEGRIGIRLRLLGAGLERILVLFAHVDISLSLCGGMCSFR